METPVRRGIQRRSRLQGAQAIRMRCGVFAWAWRPDIRALLRLTFLLHLPTTLLPTLLQILAARPPSCPRWLGCLRLSDILEDDGGVCPEGAARLDKWGVEDPQGFPAAEGGASFADPRSPPTVMPQVAGLPPAKRQRLMNGSEDT
jgi:hypothetical protein